MEIPQDLKSLYKHWEKHTKLPAQDTQGNVDENLLREIEKFSSERMRVWEEKTRGKKQPYTKDVILQKYKFCNIYRELDRQTIEIHKDLKPLESNFSLWLLNLAFHRFVSKPETVKAVGHLNFENNQKTLEKLRNLEKPKYGAAYIFPVSTIQESELPTREEFFCLYLQQKVPEIAKLVANFDNKTVIEALEVILPVFGYNMRFHWTEILIDVAYQYPDRIELFKDFHIGPGALPTAKRLNSNLDPVEIVNLLTIKGMKSFPHLTHNQKPVQLSAENWEGIFCEFRKYSNLKQGQGRKRIYRPYSY